jgi:NAD(P)-dependent dehydrogenase (short-subunit alcohol dehydrogenase family)
LLDTLKASGTPSQKSRVVNVSSSIHQIDKSGLDDIQLEKSYNSFKAYRQSKMMNIWFTYELARRLTSENAHVTANALHPGTVRTNFGTGVKDINGIALSLIKPFFTTPEKGAQTQIYLASSPEVEGVSGGYFIKSKPATPNKHANNTAYWSHLWAYSEGIIQKLGLEAV